MSSTGEAATPEAGTGWGPRLAAWLEAVGDRLNPILVKETRQAVKSKQFTLWFVLLLIACWIATIASIAIIGPSIYYVSAGGYLLYVYYVILAVPLVVVTPFAAYRSLAAEQEENTRDLIEVSSLTPRQVVNGKLGSAAIQVLIYCSALAPCIAFTYLLRGVEAALVAVLLVHLVAASMGLSVAALTIASAAKQRYSHVVLSVGLAAGLFGALYFLLGAARELLKLDTREFWAARFWWQQLAIASFYVPAFALAHAAATALNTFAAANRSTSIRVALFALQAVFVAWVAGGVASDLPRDSFVFAAAVAGGYWFLAGAVMSGEGPVMSERVRRSLPQSLLGRATLGWFHPGSGTGFVFAVMNLLAVMAPLAWVCRYEAVSGRVGPEQSAWAVLLMAGYVIAYLAVGRLVVVGLRRLAELSFLGGFLVQAMLALGGCAAPYVASSLSERVRLIDAGLLTVSSPFWVLPRWLDQVLSPAGELTVVITVGCVAGAALLANLALAGHEARQQRVAAPERVQRDDAELAPDEPAKPTSPWDETATAPG